MRGWSAAILACLVVVASEADARGGRFWIEAKNRRVSEERSELAKVARRALPAVVAITTRSPEGLESLTDEEPQKGVGSGFIIHPDGYILTAAHVIENAVEIRVSFLDAEGPPREYLATVVGEDGPTDCALLKIDAGRKLPTLALGSAKSVQVADWIVVIGNPFGLSHSVTVGVISFKGRTDVVPSGRTGYFDYLQTDASINPGNSGGPMLNLRGEVIAVANAVNVAGQGIGFGIPIDMAKEILPQLKSRGQVARGWMGITVQDPTPQLIEGPIQHASRGASGHVLVTEVLEGGPAHKAGIRVGDQILDIDGQPIDRAHALRWQVATRGAGQAVKVRLKREGKPLRVGVKLVDMPEQTAEADGLPFPASEPEAPLSLSKPKREADLR